MHVLNSFIKNINSRKLILFRLENIKNKLSYELRTTINSNNEKIF